jgi:CelD/BcsL family acetyltransferase involved in cellulose biosynthesis
VAPDEILTVRRGAEAATAAVVHTGCPRQPVPPVAGLPGVEWTPGMTGAADSDAFEIRCLHTVEQLEALAPEWDARVPFSSPAWNLAWWKHLRARSLLARDSLCVYALYDKSGALIAVAPMVITRRPARGTLSVRELRFFGADANVTELRGLVCAPDDYERCAAALFSRWATAGGAWHLMTWSGLRRPPQEWQRAHYPALVWRRQTSDFCLELPASWNDFRRSLPRNARESMRKCYNSLKRDGHAFELRIVTEREHCLEALAVLFRLHRARSKSTGTIGHADVFRDSATRAFLREYATYSAARGELRIFQLLIAGKVVATRVGFLLGRDLYLYYSGYDSAWAAYSVMTTVVVEAIKWSIENGVTVVNLSTGDDTSKTRWRPTRQVYHDAALRSGSAASRAAFAAGESVFLSARDGHRTVRRWLQGMRARLLARD